MDQYLKKKELIWPTSRALGNIWREGMVEMLERVSQQKIVEELEEKINFLLKEAKELKDKLGWKAKEAQLSMWKANEAIEVI